MKSFGFILLTFTLLITPGAWAAEPAHALVPKQHFALFEKYCLECHDSLTEKGEVNLEELAFELNTIESAEMWQKVLNSMNSGEMPPKDEPQVSDEEKTQFLEDLSEQMVAAREILSDSGGVITMRRLNRREYENTVYDLLGVRVDAGELPDDANSGGFDTAGGALFFSSDQFEQYLALAHEALDETFVFGKQAPKPIKEKRESETFVNQRFKKISTKLKTDFDRGQAWRATEGSKTPADFGFIDESDVKFHERIYNQQYATYREYLEREESKSGVLLYRLFNGAVVDNVKIGPKWPTGKYEMRVAVGALKSAPAHERFLEYGLTGNGARAGEMEVLGCVRVWGSIDKPQIIKIPITVPKTGSRDFGLRQRQPNSREATRSAFVQSLKGEGTGPAPALWIDWVEVEGPIHDQWPPRGVKEIFFKGREWWKQPDEDAYAREIIHRFAQRAFRIKEPSEAFLEKLFALFQEQKKGGKKFHKAIQEPLAVVMASPGFLYQIEPAPDQEKRELSDEELAVRLAYFLWSSPPDETLYALARAGKLKKPAVLAAQAERLLNDPRADEWIASFAHQWLDMERLDFFQFDYKQFPKFDASVKAAARQEVYKTLRSILDENRPLADLLKADHIVINDLMANYYGIEGIKHKGFNKVTLPETSPRGGLLGMAAILAMGSDGTRSSPVERGAWVMRKLLDSPPPPAPPNVPQLSRLKGQMLNARGILKAHTEEAQCAQCHRKIDPIGFGLENFDAAGAWRSTERVEKVVKKKVTKRKQMKIDASGQLPQGEPFADYFEMRDQIAKKAEDFERGFTEAVIEYALGRPYGFSDESLRERILKRADAKGGGMREILIALVLSKPFKTKK